MPKKKRQTKNHNLLFLFAYNEKRIKQLYSLYAVSFPSEQAEWQRLALEEGGHAAILHSLGERFQGSKDVYLITASGFRILGYVRRFLEKEIRRARRGKVLAAAAITTAIRLELSMLEKRYFDVFESATAEIKSGIERLNRETEIHASRLRKMLKKYGDEYQEED
jgi:hypothetical protein